MSFLEQHAADTPLVSGGPSGYSRKQVLIFLGCILSLALLGWVDYVTGYELGFFIMYSVPVGLVAWHLGRWPGILMALLASIAWWRADFPPSAGPEEACAHFHGAERESKR